MSLNTTFRIVLTKPVAHIDMSLKELEQRQDFNLVPYSPEGKRQEPSNMPMSHQLAFLAAITPDPKYRWYMEYHYGSKREISHVVCSGITNLRRYK